MAEPVDPSRLPALLSAPLACDCGPESPGDDEVDDWEPESVEALLDAEGKLGEVEP